MPIVYEKLLALKIPEVVQAYTIPMVGNIWRGHMVKAQLGGRVFMGHVNDYVIGPGVPYSG